MIDLTKPVLHIPWDSEGTFVNRENRFLGLVNIPGIGTVNVQIKDPGRLENILIPESKVLLQKKDGSKRKTAWELISAKVGYDWVLVNSGFHPHIAQYILKNGFVNELGNIKKIVPEKQIGNSRLDFLILTDTNRVWIEVKGCTMAIGDIATFPDAVTSRGKKHVEELIQIVEKGDIGLIIILIFRINVNCFKPNFDIDPKFAKVFEQAKKKGVTIKTSVFTYKDSYIYYVKDIPLCD